MSARRLRLKLAIAFVLCFLGIIGWATMKYMSLPDKRILGEWRVDVDATLADWRKHKPISPQREQFWAKTWNDVLLTYYPDRYTMLFRQEGSRSFYKVRHRGKNEVVIREATPNGGKRDVVIQFDGPDRIWVPFAEGSELRQCFYRDGNLADEKKSPGLALILGQ